MEFSDLLFCAPTWPPCLLTFVFLGIESKLSLGKNITSQKALHYLDFYVKIKGNYM